LASALYLSFSPTAEALISRTVLFFVPAVGFTGGLPALFIMALMPSADFGKLKEFQVDVILGLCYRRWRRALYFKASAS
jgi:hypothetical protein